MPRGIKGFRVQINFLPYKRGLYKYEVYLMDTISGRSGTVESFKTRKQAERYVKTHLNPEIKERAKERREKAKRRRKK